MKKELEILSIEDVDKNDLENYDEIKHWTTPFQKNPKKDTDREKNKFKKKMHKQIQNFGIIIKADLAVIEYPNTSYIDKSGNHNVIYYRKKKPKSF
jgi:HSP90 family molecular chaperone